jgi:hypothetical protein
MKKDALSESSKTKPIKANLHGFLIAVCGTALYNTIRERDFLKSE